MRRRSTPARLLAFVVAGTLLTGCTAEAPEDILASARGYQAEGKTAEAEIELKRLLERNAEASEARLMLGKLLLARDDGAGAEVELQRALSAGAQESEVLPSLARAMLMIGKPRQVIDAYGSKHLTEPAAQAELQTAVAAAYWHFDQREKAAQAINAALRTAPGSAVAAIEKARMAALGGDIEGALRLLDGVLAREPANADAGSAKAYLLWLAKGDSAAALAALKAVLGAHPGHIPSLAGTVSIQFQQGEAKAARAAFETLKKVAPANPETTFFEAQFAFVDGDLPRTREFLDLLLKHFPEHTRALELAAATEYRLGQDISAQAYAARALKLQPGLALARQIMARSLLRMGSPDQALQALTPLLQGTAGDAKSLALAGEILLQMGDARRADEAFKRAVAIAPKDTGLRTLAALARLQGGQAEIATRELEALAAGDPSAQADQALVSARIAAGDWVGAGKAIDTMAAKLPGRPLPDLLRGQVLVAQRDAAGARRSFEAALAKDAKYFPAVAALASFEVATGKPQNARQRVKAYLDAVPRHEQAILLLASIPADDGTPARDAAQILVDAVREDPKSVRLQLALIERHIRNADTASALNAAQAAATALPNEPAILRALAQAQLGAGQSRQASATMYQLTALLPGDASLQMGLAEALLAEKNRDGAEAALKKALEIDRELGEAHRALAMLAFQDGDAEKALAIAREMQKRKPESALGHATEGDIQARRRNWAAAAPAYRKALDQSDASEAAIKLHTAYRALGRSADATTLAAEWEKKRPKDPAFRFYLGDLATNKGDFADAETQYRAVLSTQPANAMAMNNIAWLLQKQGKPGALAMAERANATMPNRAPILDTLAGIQAAAGKVGQAVETQSAAVSAEPRDPDLKLRLARYQLDAGQRDDARQTLKLLTELGAGYPKQAEVRSLLKSL
ncbi:hypothetical protein MASR1M6_17240 [Rubrivivax sp.]|jgi:putative PEP-CTERM system TPR-repeat lipoprotein